MTEIQQVKFSAGAEWLLGGFALLRRAPLALGLLGLIWGGLSALVSLSGMLWLNFVLFLLGPVLLGGLVYAAREVDQGRSATPAHLLQGLRDGKLPRLLAMLLPQIAALIALAVLLLAMIGTEQLQQVALVMQQMQTNPDPELASGLPAGKLLLWAFLAVLVGVLAGFFTFTAVPDVMFTDRPAFAAMATSIRACLHNLPAMIVMVVLLFIAVFAISIGVQLVVLLLSWLIGPQAAMFLGQLLMMAVLMPVIAGMIYVAWRQLLGDVPAVMVPVTSDAGGFEA